MTIPDWVVSTFSVIGFVTVWCVVAGYIAVKVGKFLKQYDEEI